MFFVLRVISGLVLLVSQGALASTATCQSAQLENAAALCTAMIGCDGSRTQKPGKDPTGAKRDACVGKAGKKFVSTWGKILSKEHKKNVTCMLDSDGAPVLSDWSTKIIDLTGYVLTGADTTNTHSNKLYANLLKATGADCAAALNANAANSKKPSAGKLAKALDKAQGKLLTAVSTQISRAQRKGVTYSGNANTDIAGLVKSLVDTVVTATGGVNAGGGPGGQLKATQIVAGDYHYCELLENGKVACWDFDRTSNGRWSSTGLEFSEEADWAKVEQWLDRAPNAFLPYVDLGTDLKVVELTAGLRHTCARFEDGRVKCWGGNSKGQLGLGDTEDRGGQWIVNNSKEMGTNLPFVNLGPGVTATEVLAAENSTCARLADGKVKCWGAVTGIMGGLGYTKVHGDQANEMGDLLPAMDTGTESVVDLLGGDGSDSTGVYTIYCAKASSGAVKCWGANSNDILGSTYLDNPMGDAENFSQIPMLNVDSSVSIKDASLTGDFTSTERNACVLLADGTVKCFVNDHGYITQRYWQSISLGTGAVVTKYVAADSGRQHCAILSPGQLKCWGNNTNGQLGQGNKAPVLNDPEMGDALPPIDLGAGRSTVDVALNHDSTCAVLDNGRVKCWGDMHYSYVGDQPNEMGDKLPYLNLVK